MYDLFIFFCILAKVTDEIDKLIQFLPTIENINDVLNEDN